MEPTENPFKIEEGEKITTRRGQTSPMRNFLKKSMFELPKDDKKHIFVSTSNVEKQSTVQSWVGQIELELRKELMTMAQCKFSVRIVKDAEKKYIGTRIYRIA